MSSHPLPAASAPDAPTEFTKADRIRQLNTIDKRISALLTSAGLALQTLTALSPPTPVYTPAERRAIFTAATASYLRGVHAVDVALKRQLAALLEAGKLADDSAAAEGEETPKDPRLDASWLNSRSQKVGTEMEGEWWARARAWVDEEKDGVDEEREEVNEEQEEVEDGDKDGDEMEIEKGQDGATENEDEAMS